METSTFSAYALEGELDLNRLATSLGIQRRYRWEEPMVLRPVGFTPLTADAPERERVYLYYFGGVVFLNCSTDTIRYFLDSMAKAYEGFRIPPSLTYHDEYSLQIDEGKSPAITNNFAVVDRHDPVYQDIISFVLAKSVALERI